MAEWKDTQTSRMKVTGKFNKIYRGFFFFLSFFEIF
jgi:hypothetical protein